MTQISHDPLHGKTLQMIVEYLVERYGWEELGKRIPVKCFTNHPSVQSSLTFLRKIDWARAKIETLYLSSNKRAYEPEDTKLPDILL